MTEFRIMILRKQGEYFKRMLDQLITTKNHEKNNLSARLYYWLSFSNEWIEEHEDTYKNFQKTINDTVEFLESEAKLLKGE